MSEDFSKLSEELTNKERMWLDAFNKMTDEQLYDERRMLLLEAHNSELKALINKMILFNRKFKTSFDELDKQNAELKIEVERLKDSLKKSENHLANVLNRYNKLIEKYGLQEESKKIRLATDYFDLLEEDE